MDNLFVKYIVDDVTVENFVSKKEMFRIFQFKIIWNSAGKTKPQNGQIKSVVVQTTTKRYMAMLV